MAKVEISVDTESKKVSVTVDGKKVSSVNSVYVCTEEAGYFMLDISQSEEIDESTRKVTMISAGKNPVKDEEQVKANARANAKASSEFPDMVEFVVPNYSASDLSAMLFGRDRT